MPAKKKKPTKGKQPTKTGLLRENRDLKKRIKEKQDEVDELLGIIEELPNNEVANAPQQVPPGIPPQPYYPMPPQQQYPGPYYQPYYQPPYSYPPQSPPQPGPQPTTYAPPQPQAPNVPEQPPAPGAMQHQPPPAPEPQKKKVNKKLVEWKDKKGNTHREMVPFNNPHEDAMPIPKVNPNAPHAFLSSDGPRGKCDFCGNDVRHVLHKS